MDPTAILASENASSLTSGVADFVSSNGPAITAIASEVVRNITDTASGILHDVVRATNVSGPINETNITSVPMENSMDWNLDLVQWLWFGSGIASAIAAFWSFHTMDQHIRYNKHGVMRAYVVRIIFMVPIYAMAAWLGLIQENFSMWWNVVREVYEAFTIYSFIRFLVGYLGGEGEVKKLVSKRYEAGRRLIYHMWPCNKCWRGPSNPKRFMGHVKFGVMQYVVVQVITAVLEMYLTAVGRFKEGEWKMGNAYPWFVVIKNCSQTWALYDLVWFYHNLQAELSGCNPLPKAMCIKGVVFFTYWQSVLFSILASFGLLDPFEKLVDAKDAASALQNFVICFEMFIAAVLHAVYFPYDEFNALPPRDADMSLDNEARLPPSPMAPPFEMVREDLVQNAARLVEMDRASPLSGSSGSHSTEQGHRASYCGHPEGNGHISLHLEGDEGREDFADGEDEVDEKKEVKKSLAMSQP